MKAHFRRVVLFGIDGGGTYFDQANTPHIDRIFKDGAISHRTLTEMPTVSAECWGSMLHAVDCHTHKLTNWSAWTKKYPVDSAYPSVFCVIREAMPEAKLASFSDWGAINAGIIEDNLGVYKFSARDYAMIQPAIEYIKENDFTLLFFQFDSVDEAGHGYTYGSPEHLSMISTNDSYIHHIVNAIQARGWGDDTLFLLEADHGGIHYSHGGDSDEEKYVRFAAAGKGITRGEITGMEVRDTSAVILHALGIAQPESWTGRVPGGIFDDIPETLPRPAGIPQPRVERKRDVLEEKGEFTKTFADLNPVIYLPFDEEVEPVAAGLTQHGKLYRLPGVMGKGMRFDDGWLSMDCPTLKDGYTIMTWIRPESKEYFQNRPFVVAGTCPSDKESKEPGVLLTYGGGYLFGRICDENGISGEAMSAIPSDYIANWSHMAVSVDAKTRKLCVYMDFDEYLNWDIPEGLGLVLNGKTLGVAQDSVGGYDSNLPAELDDFCVFGKAIGAEEIARLKEYYKV